MTRIDRRTPHLSRGEAAIAIAGLAGIRTSDLAGFALVVISGTSTKPVVCTDLDREELIAALALVTAVVAGESFPSGETAGAAGWCGSSAARNGTVHYCDLRTAHDEHRAPGNEEGDPDITWTDGDAAIVTDEDGHAVPDPLSIACPSCGAPAGERCSSDFGCMARYYAARDALAAEVAEGSGK